MYRTVKRCFFSDWIMCVQLWRLVQYMSPLTKIETELTVATLVSSRGMTGLVFNKSIYINLFMLCGFASGFVDKFCPNKHYDTSINIIYNFLIWIVFLCFLISLSDAALCNKLQSKLYWNEILVSKPDMITLRFIIPR